MSAEKLWVMQKSFYTWMVGTFRIKRVRVWLREEFNLV